MAPPLGISKLGLKCPAISTIIDQLRWIILAGRGHDSQACSKDRLLLPRLELLYSHCRATLEIHREPESSIQKARTIRFDFIIHNCSLEVANAVRYCSGEMIGPAKEIQ